jgi:hypothetical protein
VRKVGLHLREPVSGITIDLPPLADPYGMLERILKQHVVFCMQNDIEAEIVYEDAPDEP